jgi:prepilin-type processing-associated H-X9-DG protein
LLPVLSKAKQRAWTVQCLSNLCQIGMGMRMYADDNHELFPESGGVIPWDFVNADASTNSWLQQIFSYVQNTNVYHCPANAQMPAADWSSFNYFNGCRAAFVVANDFASVDSKRIRFPAAYVLSGDTIWTNNDNNGPVDDADKDDYVQNCVGGDVNGTPAMGWQAHSQGQNILFADGHVKWYKGYDTNEMTFRYDSMHGWE